MLSLAGCPSITDDVLKVRPFMRGVRAATYHFVAQHLTFVLLQAIPTSVTMLTLAGCDLLTGAGLGRLSRLQTLQLNSCPQVTEAAIQASMLGEPGDSVFSCRKRNSMPGAALISVRLTVV